MYWIYPVALPTIWPLPSTQFLIELEGTNFILGADPTGRLIVFVKTLGAVQVHSTFQPIQSPGRAKIVLEVTFSEEVFSIRINGISQLKNTDEAFIIDAESANVEPPLQLPQLRFDTNNRQSYTDRLFLETVADLEAKLTNGSEYSLLRASGILRQLLCDDLINVANRFRHKFLFEVCTETLPPKELEIVLCYHGVKPVGKNREFVVLDAFLGKTAALISHERISVRDVIDAVANNRGGIHLRKKPRPDQAAVIEMDRLGPQIQALSLKLIKEISTVTMFAVAPLVLKIQRENGDMYAHRWLAYMPRSIQRL